MPDIIFPNSQTDGDPADAAKAAENLYTPRVAPDTLAAVNGFLDKDNLDVSVVPLERELVRPGAYAGGGMVGATANQDFFDDWYKWFTSPLDDIDDSGITVPGAAIEYRLDFNVTVLYLKWHVGVIVDGPADLTGVPPGQASADVSPASYCNMRLYIDGVPVPRYTQAFKGSRFTLLDRQKAKYQYPNNNVFPDHRWWTCTAAFHVGDPHSAGLLPEVLIPSAAGFHTAEIRLAQRGNVARCKTRNMSYRYLR